MPPRSCTSKCRISKVRSPATRVIDEVDEDGVDFVNDCVVQPLLYLILQTELHVVTQVVEAELIVRAISDVTGVVRNPLL